MSAMYRTHAGHVPHTSDGHLTYGLGQTSYLRARTDILPTGLG